MSVKTLIKQVLFNLSSRKSRFARIYRNKLFGGNESISGPGSNLEQTQTIREALPGIIETYTVRSMVDAPCGDFYWMSRVALNIDKYIGIDIVPELIKVNRQKFEIPGRTFMALDIVSDTLPPADLIMCRDCFIHLSNKDIATALRNMHCAGYKYLLTTTFPDTAANTDIATGQVRLINLQLPPFNFPAPIAIINENCTEGDGRYADKSLALWKLSDIKVR